MNAAMMYVTKTQLTSSRIFSMRWKLPDIVSSQMRSATSGTEMLAGTPKSARPLAMPARPLAMPANSEIVTAVLAMSSAAMASTLLRTPNRSRISDARPLPVTQPQRAAVSCVTISSTVITGSIHSIL